MPQDAGDQKDGGNLPQIRSIALVAVGSNKPFGQVSIENCVLSAIERLGVDVGVIRAKSALYATPAFPAGSGPDFVNAAVALETRMPPSAVLKALHEIEAQFARDRSKRWGPRTLDLDLIGYDDVIRPDRQTFLDWSNLPLDEQMRKAPDGLILPHPRLAERAFVLVPLADVAPAWVHPITGVSVGEMLSALPDAAVSDVTQL